uniref:Integrase catalytic domain-containing protein n=1 Tax=Mycena chlorophos TaxID=658473 RepID=A0ABQ0LFA1_MYCCL|nr:predicted protein [Mycena chlorophos]
MCGEKHLLQMDSPAVVREAYAKEEKPIPAYLEEFVKETEMLLPDVALKWDDVKREPYERIADGRADCDTQGLAQESYARNFYLSRDGRLFRRGREGTAQVVVEPEHRMFMLKAAHDSLGHRGVYATKSLLELRLWWPELERDVSWYIKTCHLCQVRQTRLLKISPVPTHTPSLFRKIHTDVMVMGATSNGHKLVIAARDSLSRWLEAMGLRSDNAAAVGRFLLEFIICRWGCPEEIVTDNALQFLAALEWLEKKYGIKGIKISLYNSQANGPVESGHRDVRQSIVKACGGNVSKWYWFLPQVVWADRVTVRRGLGCSPYFAATGCHPILPFDIVKATWLVEYPDRIITTAELVGLRAKALAKHRKHILEMRSRVSQEKLAAVRRYEEIHKAVITDYNFAPGDLVLIRNTCIEKSLDKKAKFRYLGPMVVVRRTKGGSYLVCELNGAMWPGKVTAFRVIPYESRRKITIPEDVEKLIDMTTEELKELEERADELDEFWMNDLQFDGVNLDSEDSENEE